MTNQPEYKKRFSPDGVDITHDQELYSTDDLVRLADVSEALAAMYAAAVKKGASDVLIVLGEEMIDGGYADTGNLLKRIAKDEFEHDVPEKQAAIDRFLKAFAQ